MRLVHHRGNTRREVAYAVTGLPPEPAEPARLPELWRGHESIENQVFRVRDVTVAEDRCQIRAGAAPQIMAALCNPVIGLLRTGKEPNVAAALRRCATKATYSRSRVGAPVQ
jgi:hypothetical protein